MECTCGATFFKASITETPCFTRSGVAMLSNILTFGDYIESIRYVGVAVVGILDIFAFLTC
jgi:hypothetical protein